MTILDTAAKESSDRAVMVMNDMPQSERLVNPLEWAKLALLQSIAYSLISISKKLGSLGDSIDRK